MIRYTSRPKDGIAVGQTVDVSACRCNPGLHVPAGTLGEVEDDGLVRFATVTPESPVGWVYRCSEYATVDATEIEGAA